MRELNKLKQELLIMKTNNIKPNYAELARIHNCDYRTVKKYDNGYKGKPTTRNKESRLDKYKDEIKSKLELPGSTIKGTYEFFKEKDESCNRFMSWLIPYNNEFETEEDLIKIIEEINLKVNKQTNETIGVPPIMLFQKEKEYLKPLPNDKILNSYLYDTVSVKISNESLFYYKGSKYSVPIKFINHTVSLREENNKLYVYYNKELITIHELTLNYINYKEEHYNEGLRNILKNKEQEEIDLIARKNLKLINKLSEV